MMANTDGVRVLICAIISDLERQMGNQRPVLTVDYSSFQLLSLLKRARQKKPLFRVTVSSEALERRMYA